MLTEEEKKSMSGYLVWQYYDLPAGYEVVDVFLSRPPGTAAPSSPPLSPEGMAHFLIFETFPAFRLHAHLYRNEDIDFLQECLALIGKSGIEKKIDLFIHPGGTADLEAAASIGKPVIITLQDWEHLYGRQKTPCAPHLVILSLRIIPESAAHFHQVVHRLYQQGVSTFLTRFDPRPEWSEKHFTELEKSYLKCAQLYVRTMSREPSLQWDEMEARSRRRGHLASFACRSGQKVIAISSHGTAYPCPHLLEKGGKSHIMGELTRGIQFRTKSQGDSHLHYIRHPHYCQWECGLLRRAGYEDVIGKYDSLLERVYASIARRVVNFRGVRAISPLPEMHGIPQDSLQWPPAVLISPPPVPASISHYTRWKENEDGEDPRQPDRALYLPYARWTPVSFFRGRKRKKAR